VEGVDPQRPGWVRGTSCRYVAATFAGHSPALVRRRAPVRAVGVADGLLLSESVPENGVTSVATTVAPPRRIPLPSYC
jgi:hypothetical protein